MWPPGATSDYAILEASKVIDCSARRFVSGSAFALVVFMATTTNARTVNRLPQCPDKPNCVSSQASDSAHQVDPILFTGSPTVAWEKLGKVLATESRTRIVDRQEVYLHAEAHSLIFRFVDDVEFLLDSKAGVIHVRSAARSGYSDLGVNRRRVERIRKKFQQ
jgi:uncharacterized protein (DUF1499 family)